MIISAFDLATTLLTIQHFFAGMDPAYADLVKLLVGTTSWIGGLTLFMWVREKKKHRLVAAGHAA
jgi:C4-dicarboxylate transporter